MPGTTVAQKLNQGCPRRLGILPAFRQTGAAGALFWYFFGQTKK